MIQNTQEIKRTLFINELLFLAYEVWNGPVYILAATYHRFWTM